MAVYIRQHADQLKHLSLLRKIIHQQMTGRLFAMTAGDDKELIILNFCSGDFVNTPTLIHNLKKFISWPIAKFKWKPCVVEANPGWLEPTEAISKALTNLPIHRKRLNTYRCTFSKLPEMTMKAIPIHRYYFGDIHEHQRLYNLSLQGTTLRLAVFFQNLRNEDVLLSRVRAALLAFLMGHLVQAPKAEPNRPTPQQENQTLPNRSGFASRIMQKLRRAA